MVGKGRGAKEDYQVVVGREGSKEGAKEAASTKLTCLLLLLTNGLGALSPC